MIISASRRTDIPAFYSKWLLNRLKAGEVLVRNPYSYHQVSRLELSPRTVDCLVFWTKDTGNLLPYLTEIDSMGYRYYFQFTLNPYKKELERHLRDKEIIIADFIRLSEKIGSKRIVWRYDPIIVDNAHDVSYHCQQFERLCQRLAPYTRSVTISFVDNYRHIPRYNISQENIIQLAEFISKTAQRYQLPVQACCETIDFTSYGIKAASCIDKEIIEEICGVSLAGKVDKYQRQGCHCLPSVDIGAYNTCFHDCLYCYANTTKSKQHHDENSSLLIGDIDAKDRISDKKMNSLLETQLKLF